MNFDIWTYRRPFTINGESFVVAVGAGIGSWRSRLLSDRRLFSKRRMLAQEQTRVLGPDADYRNHTLPHRLADGSALEVECGYISLWNVVIAVRLNGVLVHESHPGRTIAWPHLGGQGPLTEEERQRQRRDRDQWLRNRPSIVVDLILALLFFAVSKLTGSLTTAALVGAGAGLLVVVAQRFVKVDLLGGPGPVWGIHAAGLGRLLLVVPG